MTRKVHALNGVTLYYATTCKKKKQRIKHNLALTYFLVLITILFTFFLDPFKEENEKGQYNMLRK